ncbi:MAG: hypothetical protein MH204_01830, partial [Fimbriimonadaceae bacterium]|nr:hypothetical protein [Fimbriimonadaceae bacterium]
MKSFFLLLAGAAVLGLGAFGVPSQSRQSETLSASSTNVGSIPQGLVGISISGVNVQAPVPGARATVIALSSVTCPLCQKYEPTLAALEDVYSRQG